jgi:predicted ATPase
MKHKNYKAAISGVHSQGKTTLMDALKQNAVLSDLRFSFLSGVARSVGKYLPINEGGTLLTQYMVLSKHVEASLQPGRWLTDRSVLDVIAYTKYHYEQGDIARDDFLTLQKVAYTCIAHYNRIFYIVPELPVVDDGTRSTDINYFDDMKINFEYYVKEIQEQDALNKIVFVKGSVKERTAIIESKIEQDLS